MQANGHNNKKKGVENCQTKQENKQKTYAAVLWRNRRGHSRLGEEMVVTKTIPNRLIAGDMIAIR